VYEVYEVDGVSFVHRLRLRVFIYVQSREKQRRASQSLNHGSFGRSLS
jgi:hypothetical protein